MYEYISEELKKLNKWVCWRLTNGRKVPINARTGGFAQSNNPYTWSDFTTAVNSAPNFSGIGFVFDSSGYFGVDIDKADSAIGEFITALQSYAEYSQSGRCIHIICRGTLPQGGRRHECVEMYESDRFFVMTGNYCSEYAEISEGTQAIAKLHSKYIASPKQTENSPARTRPKLSKDDDDILSLAMNSRQGLAFSALYSGNWQDNYNSQSKADMALCSMFAFWCGKNIEMMDKLFRRSGLMRNKWNRKQSGTTYGAITLKRAADTCSAVYSPQQPDAENYFIEITGRREPKQYTFDDMGNARRMLDLFGEKIRFNYNDKKWFFTIKSNGV